MKHVLPDNVGRRSGIDRREFSYPPMSLSVDPARGEGVGLIEEQNRECQNNLYLREIGLSLNGVVIMIEILKKMFEANPEKSKIVLKEKCSDCGTVTIIEITPTSVGHGMQGGVLLKSSTDKYISKCPACYEKHFKIDDNT